MGVTAETQIIPRETVSQAMAAGPSRRADLEAKQRRVAELLKEVGCEGLLVLDPDNFGWLSSGGAARSILDPDALPGLYFSSEGRWVLSSNTDSQRLFDEELDEMGFQLKEWPWHWGRQRLLSDLCQNRTVASDLPWQDCQVVGDRLRQLRRALSPYEQACFQAVGAVVSHALEATCRTLTPGETEREVAGQLAHRLMHRGVLPVAVGVSADGRSRRYRQFGFTATPVRNSCVVWLAGRKYGLCAEASRAVSFGPAEPALRQAHNAACKVSATYLASSWPDAVPRQILTTGRRVYLLSGVEHEWLLCPQGHVTGRTPVELPLTPNTEELFQAGWGVTWSPSVGAASSCDTFLVTDKGADPITPTENWPLKKIKVQGAEFTRPDVLQR
jgi:Xaa-Pro aminopeptidase